MHRVDILSLHKSRREPVLFASREFYRTRRLAQRAEAPGKNTNNAAKSAQTTRRLDPSNGPGVFAFAPTTLNEVTH